MTLSLGFFCEKEPHFGHTFRKLATFHSLREDKNERLLESLASIGRAYMFYIPMAESHAPFFLQKSMPFVKKMTISWTPPNFLWIPPRTHIPHLLSVVKYSDLQVVVAYLLFCTV